MKYILLGLFLLLIVGAGAMLLSNSANKSSQTMKEQTTATIPTVQPLTKDNADTTLMQADQTIQSSLDQSDTDLQDEAKVDSSQDDTSGL